MAKQVSKEEFEKIIDGDKTILVDFFATWCGPCQMMTPIIDELEGDLDKDKLVEVVKVDIDEDPELAARYSVMGVPTFLVLKNGKEVSRQVGATTKGNLLEKVKQAE